METTLSPFVASYVETALWSSTDGDGNALDSIRYMHAEIAPESMQRMVEDCERFQTEYTKAVNALDYISGDFEETQVAHDFWLTRNRHGAGFWDGDYPEAVGKALTELAHSFGECELYVGDDGSIYI